MKNKFIKNELLPYIETLDNLYDTISKREEEINEYELQKKFEDIFDVDQNQFINSMKQDAECEIERCYNNIKYLGKEALELLPEIYENRIIIHNLIEKIKPKVSDYNNCHNSILAMKNSYRSSNKKVSDFQAYIDLKNNKKFKGYSEKEKKLIGVNEEYNQLQFDNSALTKLELVATGKIRPIETIIITDNKPVK